MMDPYAGIGWLVKFTIYYGLLAWFMCGAFSSHVASEKDRCGICWFFWGVLFGPMALLAVAGLPRNSVRRLPTDSADREARASSAESYGQSLANKARNPGMWIALAALIIILYLGFR